MRKVLLLRLTLMLSWTSMTTKNSKIRRWRNKRLVNKAHPPIQISQHKQWFRIRNLKFYLVTMMPWALLKPAKTIQSMKHSTKLQNKAKKERRSFKRRMHKTPATRYTKNLDKLIAIQRSIELRRNSKRLGPNMMSITRLSSKEQKPTTSCKTSLNCDVELLNQIKGTRSWDNDA